MKRWWESFPGRLETEEDALRAEGIRVCRDETAFARGLVRLELDLPEGYWLTQRLTANYPDSFPRTRPEVYAPDLRLSHHQNPFRKNLCLLGRASENWVPSWTLAKLLREQLPKLATALQSADHAELAALEIEQGEPLTEFLDYENDSIVFIDSDLHVPDAEWGLLEIATSSDTLKPLRAELVALADSAGKVLWTSALRKNPPTMAGAWIKTDRLLEDEAGDAGSLLKRLEDRYPLLKRAPWHHGIQVFALFFPEEHGHRRDGIGLVFVARRRVKDQKHHGLHSAFVRAGRVGPADLSARLPEFRQLQTCGAAVFGLGCIGAPSALEFARGGVRRLNILDPDIVEAGTTVRWLHGLTAAGRHKHEDVYRTIQQDYPWVHVQALPTRIGLPDQHPPEAEALEIMLKDVDLVYDATAEHGIQNVLASEAHDRKLPYICVSATNGGWGGVVARFHHRPGSGCWWCFQKALDSTIPSPAADPAGVVQPAGCNRLTYVGANFDIMEIALQGVRLSIATLLARSGQSEHDYPWDVAVLNLRDAQGDRIVPQWLTYSLEQHSECPICSTR